MSSANQVISVNNLKNKPPVILFDQLLISQCNMTAYVYESNNLLSIQNVDIILQSGMGDRPPLKKN